MRRLLVVALLLASSAAYAGPLTSSGVVHGQSATLTNGTRGVAARHVAVVNFKYNLLRFAHTGPREHELGDLTF